MTTHLNLVNLVQGENAVAVASLGCDGGAAAVGGGGGSAWRRWRPEQLGRRS